MLVVPTALTLWQTAGIFGAVCQEFKRGYSSTGRAPASHAGGYGFESRYLHQKKSPSLCRSGGLFNFIGSIYDYFRALLLQICIDCL